MTDYNGAVPALAKALEKRGYSELTPVQKAMWPPNSVRPMRWFRRRPAPARRWPSASLWRRPCSEARALRPRRGTAGAGDGADPRTGVAGDARAGMALRADRRHRHRPASAAWTCARERRVLERGAHIVVGTPGRLRDHITRHSLDMSALKAVVLDEADEMLDLGFREDLEFILDAAPAERRTLMFSATVPRSIATLAQGYQRDAVRISAAGEEKQHLDIEYRALSRCPARPRERHHQRAALLRSQERAGVLQHACRRQSSDRALQQPQLLRRGAVGRTQPERAQPCLAGDARRSRPGLHRHRCRGARHRPAQPRTGHPRRPADQSGNAAAPQRPHRPRRAQGRQRADRAQQCPQAHRAAACRTPASRRHGRARPPPTT
jgi:hypothetical protein